MESMHYIGLDIHKKIIAFCIKHHNGTTMDYGTIPANRKALGNWAKSLPFPWTAAMEATLFTSWIYDFLKPHAYKLKVAHPEMLKAITAAKKKNDKSDAEKIANLLRVDLLPECYMLPSKLRELRRILRYRNFVVRSCISEKNKIAGLLMEVGASYSKKRLYGKKYFSDLLENIQDVPDSVINMLRLSRSSLDLLTDIQKRLICVLKNDPIIRDRVNNLQTIDGVGEVTALTWVLEIGEPNRFSSIAQAVSYCGLCAAQRESAGKERRGPISKKRNKHLQKTLVEAAKLAPIWNDQLAEIYTRSLEKGNRNRATVAVARKMVGYMLAVDKSGRAFKPRGSNMAA